MQITQESASTTLQELTPSMGGPQQGGGNPSPDGEMPQGDPPAGEPGGNGQPLDASQMDTPPANGIPPDTGMILPQLLNMIIQLLETKVSS